MGPMSHLRLKIEPIYFMSTEGNFSDQESQPEQPDRRGFIRGASCFIGAAVGAVPMTAGIRVLIDPIVRKNSESEKAEFIRLAELTELQDGEPMKFAIVENKSDKWSRYTDVPVGAVYLLKRDEKVIAYNTVCPHLGCFVDYRESENDFFCPCHDSQFNLDGKLTKGVSPRPMDELAVEIRNGVEVWVKFERFKSNTKEKIVI